MILLSLVKELYSKLVSEDTELTLEFLEEKAEFIFNHKNLWKKEINKEIKTLSEDMQEGAAKIANDILESMEAK